MGFVGVTGGARGPRCAVFRVVGALLATISRGTGMEALIPSKKNSSAQLHVFGSDETSPKENPDPLVMDDDGPDDFFDFQQDLREVHDRARREDPQPDNAPVKLPPKFEDVTLCAAGPCRWFFRLEHPSRIKGYEGDTGNMRPMVATVRRCLIGAVKLDVDDPAAASVMKNLGTEAPYGALSCSHYAPLTDEEIAEQTDRQLAALNRIQRERELTDELAKNRDAHASARPVVEPELTEDPPDPFDKATEE